MGQRSIPELQQLAYLAMQETGDLSHHGVKGMKWGVQRSQAELDREAGRTRKERKWNAANRKHQALQKAAKTGNVVAERPGRAERRRMNAIAKTEFYTQKVNAIVKEASTNPDTLFKVRVDQTNRKYLVSGKQLTEHMAAGGIFDALTSDIVGRPNQYGGYDQVKTIGKFKKVYR